MPNLNERARVLWDRTTQMMANSEAKASFLQQIDSNADGKVTAAEVLKMADDNHDGLLDSAEVEKLAIKAAASDFDRTSIKAMAQAAISMPQLVLFESEAPPVPPTVASPEPAADTPPETPSAGPTTEDGPAPAESPVPPVEQTPAPPPLRTWKGAAGLDQLKQSYRTSIAYQPGNALPSRNPEALKVIRPGLFRLQEQKGNSCGTTSLSMVLKFWQGHTLENTVTTIDQHIRANGSLELALPGGVKNIPIDGFTAPRAIVDYAKAHGMRAGMRNHASLSELKSYLDKGVPLMCLTDWNFSGGSYEAPAGGAPDGKSLHWVDIIGYEYKTNPDTQKQEMYLTIGNPWGVVQQVSETDFTKVWSKLNLEVPGGKKIDTGMDRLFVAMVPRDDERPVISPAGTSLPAGEISIPSGDDGFKGWVAKKTSDVLQDVSSFQQRIGEKSGQVSAEVSAGYAQAGLRGALRNLVNGDAQDLDNLRQIARNGGVETKAEIIQELMAKQLNRQGMQQLIFDILHDVPFGKDFDQLLSKLDTANLAGRLSDDAQAGQVLAWIAKSEVDRSGQTGPKFESFASQLAIQHRSAAIQRFASDDHVVKQKLIQKIPASLVRDAIKRLMQGITTTASETAIYQLFKASSWNQFDQITSRLDMGQVAGEISSNQQLGDITSWTIEQGIKTGNWNSTSEVLNHLGSLSEFGRADDVLGHALTQPNVLGKLNRIPAYLRVRMIDLLDDVTRWRSDEAVKALKALKQVP